MTNSIVSMDVQPEQYLALNVEKLKGTTEWYVVVSVHEWAEAQKRAGFACGHIPNGPKTDGINVRDEIVNSEFDKQLYKDMVQTFESPESSFFLTNLGIYLWVDSVEKLPDGKLRINFDIDSQHGISQGGGTNDKILRMSAGITNNYYPDHDYVKVFIRTGLDKKLNADITKGLNTGKLVTDVTIANAKGEFQWVKDALAEEHIDDAMSFYMDETTVDGRKMPHNVSTLAVCLTLFMDIEWQDSDTLTDENIPNYYCCNMKSTIKTYNKQANILGEKFQHVYVDICRLYDHIQATYVGLLPSHITDKDAIQAFAAMRREPIISPFTGQEINIIKKPIMMSAMWCLRYFLVTDALGQYQWRNDLHEAIKFWDMYGHSFCIEHWANKLCDDKGAKILGIDTQKLNNDKRLWRDLTMRTENALNKFYKSSHNLNTNRTQDFTTEL